MTDITTPLALPKDPFPHPSTILTLNDTTPQRNKHMAILDALPYLEPIDPHYESHALSLIQQELNTQPPPEMVHSTLRDSTPLFGSNEVNRHEYETMVQRIEGGGTRIEDIEEDTYQTLAPEPKDTDDVDQWKDAVTQAKIQHESERSKLMNLEIMELLEAPTWLRHNESIHMVQKGLEEEVSMQRHKVDAINAERLELHTRSEQSLTLQELEKKWWGNIRESQHLSKAVSLLESEVESMREECVSKELDTSGKDVVEEGIFQGVRDRDEDDEFLV